MSESIESQNLIASEAKYRALFENLPLGVAIGEAHGTIISMNHAALRLHGFESEPEMLSALEQYHQVFELRYLDGRPVPPEEWPASKAIRGETVRDYVVRLRNVVKDLERVVSYTAVPVHDEHGHFRYITYVIQDLTERRKADDALHHALDEAEEGRRLLETIMEYVPDGITVADAPDASIRMVSRYGQEVLGGPHDRMTAGEVTERWKVFMPDGITPLPDDDLPLVRAIKHGEIVRNMELVQENEQGRRLTLLCNAAPIRDSAGKITGGIVAWRDITERKEAEQALEAERARLQTVLATLPVGVFIADATGRVVHVNDAARRIWGMDLPALESIPDYAEYKGWRPDTGEHYRAEDWALARALTRGETIAGEMIDIERFDGTRGTVLNSAAPIKDDQGQIVGAVVTVQDITDFRIAQQSLIETERDLKRAQAVAKTGSWRLDTRRNELLWSDETYCIFGIPRGTQMTYERFLDRIHPDDRDYVDREWTAAMAGAPYDIEHRICVDGEAKWVRETAELDFDQNGELLGGFGTVRDITDSKEIEQALDRDRRRIAAIENVAQAGTSSLDMGEVLGALASRVREGMNSHSSHIMVLDERSGELVTQATCNVPEPTGFRAATISGFIGKVYTERRTVYVADAQTDPLVVEQHVKRAGIRSLLGTPLVIGDRAVGVVYVNMLEVREFTPEEVSTLEAMASRIAPAIENARLFEEVTRGRRELEQALDRELYFSRQLQRALLPPAPEVGAGYRIGHVYIPAYAGREIGGDFYDTFHTDSGCIAIVIGDVSGKGLEAASVAAATRSTVRAFAYDLSSAAEALSHANAVMSAQQSFEGLTLFVTVFLAILNPESGEISYSSAGHPPPAVYHAADDRITFLGHGNPPIGIIGKWDYEQGVAWLRPGDKLVLYTDGLSEARSDHEMFETQGIERVLHEHGTLPPDDLVGVLVSEATQWAEGKLRDDTAVVVVEREISDRL